MISIRNEQEANQIKLYISFLTKFLREFTWLIDSFVLDFFTDNHWSKLPFSWQLCLCNVEPQDLSVWLTKEKMSYKEVWPLGLQALRIVAHTFTLSRKAVTCFHQLEQFLNSFKFENKDRNINSNEDAEMLKCSDFDHIFTRHVKPKKRHEIERIAQIAQVVLQNIKCHNVVDIGSGQGHLSRLLSLRYGFQVITMETIESHIKTAEKYDKKALREIVKKQNNSNLNEKSELSALILPKHIVYHISESTSESELIQMIKKNWETDVINSDIFFSIVGLHTCGNLAVNMIKLFLNNFEANVILSVGCCYMKLDLNRNFPLSNFLKNSKFTLTYEALEISCHAIETYTERLRRNADCLKIHCYRATLETLIVKYLPEMKHFGLHSIKHADKMPFSVYVQNALKRIDLNITPEDVSSPYINECLEHWKLVVIFYSLRLMIAPVIETLVLLDRLLFLYEKGCSCCLMPLFDPKISPRNQILIGVKPNIFKH
ncbi:protein RRNAD1-like [Centruroides sculpturatus]|uniref:protein RRNAD1-like n=2 Tax=Centruroides sculpturatus TaxID=218467 RepID=UPI000C6CD3FC|nr:protein RRNAD1-like [Centruroides sculpturatus]